MAKRTFAAENNEKVVALERIDAERDLEFVGFLVFKNNLKPQSTSVVQELHLANIKSVMITGDNILTAVAVSAELEKTVFKSCFPDIYKKLLNFQKSF